MDFVGRALIAVDRHFHSENDPQEFSERLFYNVGRLYSYGILFGGVRGLFHRAANKTQMLDAISDHAWHTSLSAASAAFVYTPLEITLRKQSILRRPHSEDVAWGAAWALTRRNLAPERRVALGCLIGASRSAMRVYGPMIANTYCDGKRLTELWRWRIGMLDQMRRTFSKLTSRDKTAEQRALEDSKSQEAVLL